MVRETGSIILRQGDVLGDHAQAVQSVQVTLLQLELPRTRGVLLLLIHRHHIALWVAHVVGGHFLVARGHVLVVAVWAMQWGLVMWGLFLYGC